MMENGKNKKCFEKPVWSRIVSVLMALALLLTMQGVFGIGYEAKADDPKLPFTLEAPGRVAVSWMKGRDYPTAMNLTYSMGDSMNQFLALRDTDETAWKKKVNDLGYEDIWVKAQMDWSLDSVSDWKYTADWDNFGQNAAGERTCGVWDAMDLGVSSEIVNWAWVFRGIADLEASEEWNGNGTFPGLKDQLKVGQYTIETDSEGDKYIKIDFSAHAMYVRVRYIVTVRPLDGTNDINYCSGWSDTAVSSGNKMDIFSMAAPVVSNLRLSGEDFNGGPVAYVTQTVTDNLKNQWTDLFVDEGDIRFLAEARIKGTEKWIALDGDSGIKNGDMSAKMIYLQLPGKVVPSGTEIEFRFRYSYEKKKGYGEGTAYSDYSAYSSVMTLKTTEIPAGPGDPVDDSKPVEQKPEESKPEPAIAALDGSATEGQVEAFVKSLKNDDDPKGTTFGFLFAKQKKATKNAITITWKKPKNAAYFVIYGNKCGKENHYERITSVTGTSYTHSGLDKGTYYKFLVSAFDKNNKHLGTSNTVHVATKGGKVCNFKKVTTAAKKNQVTLAKKGKIFKLKGKAIAESKKLKVNVHRKVRYESTNKKIATVNTAGKVTAKKKGTCYIYVYAQNGAYQKVKVTVKK